MEKEKVKVSEEEEMEFKDCEGEEEKEDNIEISDEIERSKVGIMRALAEREDPSVKVLFFKLFPFSFLLFFLLFKVCISFYVLVLDILLNIALTWFLSWSFFFLSVILVIHKDLDQINYFSYV